MKVDETTCWYEDERGPEQMLLGAKGALWPVLEKSDHFPVLSELITIAQRDSFTLLDIGCGAAEVSRVYKNFYYTGVDLPNIIKEVAMKMHPHNSYISFDIYDENQDTSFIAEYDLIVMNAFIDVLERPVYGLEKVLTKASKYVLIHRQTYHDEKETYLSKHPSYGGTSYQSIINRNVFEDLLKKYSFENVKELRLDYNPEIGYTSSILLRRK
tara:strand:- start:135 stop:773 length:639 start_codon:yes stop_codon:yes gene_type:complete